MKIAVKAAAALSSLVVASCGGGGGNAALSKTFNYGAAQAPSTTEQSAASSAQGTMSSTTAFGASPDATKATSIIALADDLAASTLGSTTIAAGGFSHDPRLSHALRTAATMPDCTTTTSTSVTFTNCTQSESGFTFTLNGSVSATSNSVTWDIHGSFSGANQGVTLNLNLHQSGTLTVTPTTVKGSALSEFGGSASGNGQSAGFGLSVAALVDLNDTPDCITAGTIEVKRVWTERPSGATGPDFADVGVKLTWSGCGTVQAQHSM